MPPRQDPISNLTIWTVLFGADGPAPECCVAKMFLPWISCILPQGPIINQDAWKRARDSLQAHPLVIDNRCSYVRFRELMCALPPAIHRRPAPARALWSPRPLRRPRPRAVRSPRRAGSSPPALPCSARGCISSSCSRPNARAAPG